MNIIQESYSQLIQNQHKDKLIEKRNNKINEDIVYFDDLPKHNPQYPIEYINKIYHNLLLEESVLSYSQKAIFDYMKYQTEINDQMRSILTDWLIDVHLKFRFTEETLYMTINIIDRYLSIQNISKGKLQLVGIAALMITCKHEEIDLPKVKDFIYITDNAYSKDELFKMEYQILSKLQFNFLIPSPLKFYEILSVGFNFTKQQMKLGKYIMETFLIDIQMLKYKSSIIACACIYIVMKFSKMGNYACSYDKKYYSLSENDIIHYSVKDCAKDICSFVDNITKTQYSSAQKKYSKSEYERVALLILGK